MLEYLVSLPWRWIIPIFFAVGYTIAAAALVHALLKARRPQSALGWAAAIVSLPFIGSLAYFLFGISRVDSRAASLMSDRAARRLKFLSENADLWKNEVFETPSIDPVHEPIARVGEGKRSSLPLLGGNNVRPLFNGDEAYPVMLESIRRAKREIFLCTYIFEGKLAGEVFAQALTSAVARGVDVRVLLDGMGSFFSPAWSQLRKGGVKVEAFLPPHLFPPTFSINLRNHRKVLVCDGTAFTGGMNIGDGNLHDAQLYERFGARRFRQIQDVHFLCTGPVAGLLREAFLMDWAFATGQDDTGALLLPPPAGDMDTRIVMDGPGTPSDAMQNLLCGVVSCAKLRVTVFTPYFLPTRELFSAFTSAAGRGVDVRVFLPEKLDHAYVGWAGERTLPLLLDSGVRVFRQPPPFAHTKLFLIDGNYVCMGSTNLDPRSLSLNFELNVEVFSRELCAQLEEYADAILAKSREVTLEELSHLSLPRQLRNAAAWIFSPYL